MPRRTASRGARPRILIAILTALLSCALFAPSVLAKGAAHPKAVDPPPAVEPPPSAEPAPASVPTSGGGEDDDTLPPPHPPVTMTVALMLRELNKFDLNNGSYNAEFDVAVSCDEEPCKPELDLANGKILGKPEKLKDEPLRKEYRIKAEIAAELDLSAYPFDSHLLPIVLQDKGDPEQIRYKLDTADTSVNPKIKLPGWQLGQWLAIAGEDEAGVSQVHFYVEANRPPLTAFFKACVPVLIMMFVAAFTLLLKPKSASGRLATATGGLMSLVMFHVGQVTSLPPQGELTRFDKLMVATYLVYLANVAFSVMMVRFEEKKNERMSELMYLAAAGAVPGLLICTWTAVFFQLV
jgi:hypothetical protein